MAATEWTSRRPRSRHTSARVMSSAIFCLAWAHYSTGQSLQAPTLSQLPQPAGAALQAPAPASGSLPAVSLDQPQLMNLPGTPAWQMLRDGRYADATGRALLRQPCNDDNGTLLAFPPPGTCSEDRYSLQYGNNTASGECLRWCRRP